MLRNYLSLNSILIGFTDVLKIDFSIRNTKDIINSSIEKLENIFHIKIDKSLYELQTENQYISKEIDILLQQIVENLKAMSLLVSVSMYDKQFGNTIKDIKYMGYNRETLLKCLQYLQDEELYKRRSDFMESIIVGVDSVEMCSTKKLFIIMIILEKLGIEEGVSIISNYIYLGGF